MSKHVLDHNLWNNQWTIKVYDDELDTITTIIKADD